MHLVMFDVDGTLLESSDFDADCYVAAVKEVLGLTVSGNWSNYQHVSDTGVLEEIVSQHGLSEQLDTILQQVRASFFSKIDAHLKAHPARPLPGAVAFLSSLQKLDDVVVSIATGGWGESALMKLHSAGIDTGNIPIASSNDHFVRTEIMKVAESKTGRENFTRKTYFGDGAWDKIASAQLGYNFVLVGVNGDADVSHHQYINDFTAVEQAMGFIGL